MTARMLPMITTATNAIKSVLHDTTEFDSSSDDGNNLMEGDTYLPMEDGFSPNNKDLVDPLYDVTYMNKDGNYDNIVSGLSFIEG